MGGMVPLRDASREPSRYPIVTTSIIVVNVVVFLLELMEGEAFVKQWALVPADIASGHHLVTIITAMFMHGGWMHIIGNMIFLWVFGDDIERALGGARYLLFYLAAGVVGGLVFVAVDPNSAIELIGASGSIAGVVIAYLMLRPCAKITVLLGIIPLRISAYWVVGLFVLTQLWNLGASSKSEVAYWCHFGGMLAGAVLFPLLKPRSVKLFECMQPARETVVRIGPTVPRVGADRIR